MLNVVTDCKCARSQCNYRESISETLFAKCHDHCVPPLRGRRKENLSLIHFEVTAKTVWQCQINEAAQTEIALLTSEFKMVSEDKAPKRLPFVSPCVWRSLEKSMYRQSLWIKKIFNRAFSAQEWHATNLRANDYCWRRKRNRRTFRRFWDPQSRRWSTNIHLWAENRAKGKHPPHTHSTLHWKCVSIPHPYPKSEETAVCFPSLFHDRMWRETKALNMTSLALACMPK